MEKCSVCFQVVDNTDIFVPPDECVKLFNNFLVSLHSSIAEMNKIPLVSGGQFPFCKMCLDSAFELNQVNEQLSAFQKQLSDLTVEFSLAILYRRNQTTTPSVVGNENARNESIKQMVEINVSGLSHKLFSLDNSKTPCEYKNNTVEKDTPTIIAENPNEVEIVTSDYQEIGSDVNDSELLEYSAETEDDDLLMFPNQNPVETENIKLELNYDRFCNSNAITHSNETEDNANCFIDNEAELQDDNSTTNLVAEVEYDNNDPLCLTRSNSSEKDKSTKISTHSSKSGNNETQTKPQILKFGRTPSIILKRVQHDQIGVTNGGPPNLLKTTVEKKSTNFRSNCSPGRIKETNVVLKRRKRAKKFVGVGPLQCEFCNKVFKFNGRLEEHRRTHTDERPFQCPFCPKAFKKGGHLNDHKRIHTGERPFKCYYCSKYFSRDSSRRSHQLTHPGVTQFKCNRCSKSFNAKSTWQKHLSFCHPKEHD